MEAYARHTKIQKLSDLMKELSQLQQEREFLELEMALTVISKPKLWEEMRGRKVVVEERITHLQGHIAVQSEVVKTTCFM